MQTMIGIIGGSGVYQIEGLEGGSWVTVVSPWGRPSDQVLVGRMAGVAMAFLPRHGRGHLLGPSGVNYRANIDALKRMGCTDIVAVSAVGSLREDYAPGDFVLVDQYIDRTFARETSFFGTGCVAHVSLADPTCTRLSDAIADVVPNGVTLHRGATYLAMEGPQFSTRAESRMYRQWGADVIGMTGMPEAKLAREAEMCYACLAMVTDYDCWHPDHGAVDVSAVIQTLGANSAAARALIAALPARLGANHTRCSQGCDHALTNAMMTAPDQRDAGLMEKLDAITARCLRT